MTVGTAVASGDRLRRHGLLLAGLTIAWNAAEAIVAVLAGVAAGSIALVGFGFDSMIEVLSAWVVVWQFRGELRGGYDERRERHALRVIGITFFVLAGYVAIEAIRDLFFVDTEPETSVVGIVLAALSLLVMPALAWAKRRTAAQLGSPTLRADATETLLCAWLSAALLAGLALNAAVGWWWADPVAALAIAALAAHEGLEAIRGDHDHDDHHHDRDEEPSFAVRCGRGARCAPTSRSTRHPPEPTSR
jgi:divalent metal cation (Fe/Co/Zn/Cd) transporter